MADLFAEIRIVDEATAIKVLNLSQSTWDRLRREGLAPPITRISEKRIGYRVSDLKLWLDERRVKHRRQGREKAGCQFP